jgi:hypothetical protein
LRYACIELLHELPSKALRGASMEDVQELLLMYRAQQEHIREMQKG